MFTEWDERFDILIGAEIRDSDAEPCLDSGVHDLLHGEAEQECQDYPLGAVPTERRRVRGEVHVRIE